jgi:hypothetical protein
MGMQQMVVKLGVLPPMVFVRHVMQQLPVNAHRYYLVIPTNLIPTVMQVMDAKLNALQ